MSASIRELYERTMRQIAELDHDAAQDITRIEDDSRRLINERWRRHTLETRELHALRCRLADALSDIEMAKPVTITITA